MLVSNNQSLNILLANNNTLLNNLLKESDSKALNTLKQNSSSVAGSILKEILNNIKDSSKISANLENILKNLDSLKSLGNLSNNISSLIEEISADEELQKFKSSLENFSKNIKDLDANSLKEQIKNSGIFLENKLAQNLKLENILNKLSNLLKNLNSNEAKNADELINNILKNLSTNPKDLASSLHKLTNFLQTLAEKFESPFTKELTTFIKELKLLINDGSLVESKLENDLNSSLNKILKNSINEQIKELLNQIKENPQIQNNKDLQNIINKLNQMPDLFIKNEILQNTSSNNISGFSNILASNLKPILDALKDILQNLEPNNKEIKEQISSFIKKIETFLKENLNGQDFVKNNTHLEQDFKSILLKMQDELSSKMDTKHQESLKLINNLLTQIDYQQLSSLVSNSNFVYIPFFWEMLEEGTIEMKQKEEDKFFCQIKLTLKNFGKLDLMLALYDENKLDLTIFAQREHFKNLLKNEIKTLKQALNKVALIPVNIKLLDMQDEEKDKASNIYQNLYNNDIYSSSRIDIKA